MINEITKKIRERKSPKYFAICETKYDPEGQFNLLIVNADSFKELCEETSKFTLPEFKVVKIIKGHELEFKTVTKLELT